MWATAPSRLIATDLQACPPGAKKSSHLLFVRCKKGMWLFLVYPEGTGTLLVQKGKKHDVSFVSKLVWVGFPILHME